VAQAAAKVQIPQRETALASHPTKERRGGCTTAPPAQEDFVTK
jgi:hypothetical protein